MNTDFLESFVSVVECGSVAEAARKLAVAPATLSQRIHALEAEIGGALLNRVGRTVAPTQAGVAILKPAKQLLADWEQLVVAAAAEKVTGHLRVGAIGTVVVGMFAEVLKLSMAANPDVSVSVSLGVSPKLYEKVLAGDLDAVIIARPPFMLPKTLYFDCIRQESAVLLTSDKVESTSLEDVISRYPFIRYDRNSWGGRLIDIYLRSQNITTNDLFELDGLNAIAVMVANGLGVTVVPDWGSPWPSGVVLRKTYLAGAEPFARHIDLVWNRSSPRAKLIEAFVANGLRPALEKRRAMDLLASAVTSSL